MNCQICGHAGAQHIDNDLANGKSDAYITERYSVNAQQLHQHREICNAPDLPASVETVMQDLAMAVRISRRQLQAADRAQDKDTILKFLDRLLKSVEVLGRALGAFPKDGPVIDARTINITSLSQLSVAELKALSTSLEPAQS